MILPTAFRISFQKERSAMVDAALRFDPYKDFKFRVKWDGKYVAGVSHISALKRTTDVIEYREGGDPSSSRKVTGLTKYAPITLKRGITADHAFEQWANQVSSLNGPPDLGHFRKDVVIELLDDAGRVLLAYNLYRCWVSEYEALPDLDADTDSIAFESITLENEGWERDAGVSAPQP
jgi:phage tail-like protein